MKQKRAFVCFSIVFALLLVLAGCGQKEASVKETVTITDKAAVAETLKETAAVDANDFVEVDAGILDNYYPGLTELSDDFLVLINGTGGLVDEIAIVTAKEGVNTSEIVTAMKERIEAQNGRFVDYVPAELPKLESAAIETYGDTVVLLISGDKAPSDLVAAAVKE